MTITVDAGKLNFLEPVKTSITSVKTWLCLCREYEGRIFIKFTGWLKARLVREKALRLCSSDETRSLDWWHSEMEP